MRTLTAIPSVVLLICLFLPAQRVCGDPTSPIRFPECYAAYVSGLGVLVMAIARSRRAVEIGAAIPIVLAIATVGTIVAIVIDGPGSIAILIATLALVIAAIRAIALAQPSERVLAIIAALQGLASAIWSAVLVADKDAMYGASVSLAAALVLTVTSMAWLGGIEVEPPVPRAVAR